MADAGAGDGSTSTSSHLICGTGVVDVPHSGVSITAVHLSPDFMRLRAELLRVLAWYPEARDEVAAVPAHAGGSARSPSSCASLGSCW